MSVLSYALYRLPYADSYTVVESEREPVSLEDIGNLGEVPGFALVPFMCSAVTPALLIRPDSITTRVLMPVPHNPDTPSVMEGGGPDARYWEAFAAFHGAVEKGSVVKIVLARSKTIRLNSMMDLSDPASMRKLFEQACRRYPRLMVMLYSTPLSGTWLVASPEILLDGKGQSLHTVALAGTMPFTEGHIEWSPKNRQEQHVVEQYIESILSNVSDDVLKDGPVTMRAGNLVHLRTDFRFHLAPQMSIGALVRQLHPTPAVCGMPKREASEFILAHEGMNRRYYSGFAGPVGINDETHLYVALRCAELKSSTDVMTATLYAGGGIMPGSSCESEWQETESKMKTIQNVLQ